MSNPTTPFGWQMPTATDLVTDLPADFEVFGQAVATSMADLLGGTTGQVLKKNSNTDMDFVWSADAAGMTNPMTTTGDTIYSSSGSTPARLGIGTTGQVLTVAGGVPSWATASSGGMTSIASGSLSGASVSLTSIPGTYNHLQLVLNNVGTSSAADTTFTLNNDTGANYGLIRMRAASVVNNANLNYFGGPPSVGAAGNAMSIILDIFNYTNTTTRKIMQCFVFKTSNSSDQALSVGGYDATAAITSLQILSGSTYSSGTYTLYGVK
jgi:hypothetical protein